MLEGQAQAAPVLPASAPIATKKTLSANITWDGRYIDLLVEWITSCAADHHVLLHDHSSSMMTKLPPGDKPSGKNKKDVFSAIAKHIFKDNPEYFNMYIAELK